MGNRIVGWIGLAAVIASLAAGPATEPGNADGPELTPRQQNLLLQLSDAEANIQAINKALKATGYSVGEAYDRIDSNLKGNDEMNRNGGGPVRWDEFYGKTAKDYPRTGFWDDRMDDHRPQQFAFVYKANNDQIARAKDQIDSLLKNQQGLLDRRQKHEADQSELWALLAWEQVKDREIEFRPLYRFALKPQGPEAAVIRPVILFLRTAASAAQNGLDSIHSDQAGTFQTASQRTGAAYAALQQSLADALDATDLKPDREKEGETLKALCKELAEQCKVMADDYANALDRDRAKEDNSKLEFRGQLQSSLSSFATELGKLDDAVEATSKEWRVEGEKGTPTTDVVVAAAIASGGTAPQLPITPVAAPTIAAVAPPTPGGSTPTGSTGSMPTLQPASAIPAAPVQSITAGTVDLLPMIDLSKDTVHGDWSLQNEEGASILVGKSGRLSRVQFPYHPPEEYDFRATFESDSNGPIGLAIPLSDGSIMWNVVFNRCCFESNSKVVCEGPGPFLTHGRHTSMVKVRKDQILAYLDDRLVCEFDRHKQEAPGIMKKWQLNDTAAVGVATWNSDTKFLSVQVVEISGPGKRMR